jgi:hypothetical protein
MEVQHPSGRVVAFFSLILAMTGVVGCSGSEPVPGVDSGAEDTREGDVLAVEDTGRVDAGTSDVGTSDVGTSDVGTSDVGTSDVGTGDVGTSDAGGVDAGTVDAGDGGLPSDGGSVDAGRADGGLTLRPHAGSSLVSAGSLLRSSSYQMLSTMGGRSIQQRTLQSPNYRLRGGLVGAIGAR